MGKQFFVVEQAHGFEVCEIEDGGIARVIAMTSYHNWHPRGAKGAANRIALALNEHEKRFRKRLAKRKPGGGSSGK